MGSAHRVGIIGLGVISQAYIQTLAAVPSVVITAVADLDQARAESVAAGLPTARALSVAELLASPDVDTVLNLTVPAAHAEIALAALAAGKSVFGEKPLAATLADAEAIMRASATTGLPVGSAPDTVLGTGTQTARAAIDAGLIGRPMAASAVMVTPGHERWHPQPDFYYRAGGGPLLDMGPYYVSALIHLLGPVVAVIGSSSRLRDERTIETGPRAGESVPVEVATHVSGVLEHANGALSTLTTSFDAHRTAAPPIEVHGERGSLTVPDPNTFDGDVRLFDGSGTEWRTLEPSAGYIGAARGAGLVDFLTASANRPARASGELALHSLEVMAGMLRSAETGCRVQIESTLERPAPVPLTEAAEWQV